MAQQPNKPEPKSEQAKADQVRAEQAQSDKDQAERALSESAKAELHRERPETAAGKRMANEVAGVRDKTERVVALKTILYRGTARREGEEFDMLEPDVAECRAKGKVRLPGEQAPAAAKPGDGDDTDTSVPKDMPALKDGTVYVRATKMMLNKGSARGKGEVFVMSTERAQQRKARGEVKILS